MGVNLVFCPQIANAKGILKNFLIEPFVPHKQVSTPLKWAFKSLWTCMLSWVGTGEKAEVWKCAVELTVLVHIPGQHQGHFSTAAPWEAEQWPQLPQSSTGTRASPGSSLGVTG